MTLDHVTNSNSRIRKLGCCNTASFFQINLNKKDFLAYYKIYIEKQSENHSLVGPAARSVGGGIAYRGGLPQSSR